MAFSTDIILTLLQLKGIASKTIFSLAHKLRAPIYDVEQLYHAWPSLQGKTFAKFSLDDLAQATHRAQRIVEQCKQEGGGLLSFYDP